MTFMFPFLQSVNFRFYLAAPVSEQSNLHEILKPCPSEVRHGLKRLTLPIQNIDFYCFKSAKLCCNICIYIRLSACIVQKCIHFQFSTTVFKITGIVHKAIVLFTSDFKHIIVVCVAKFLFLCSPSVADDDNC